MNILEVAYRYHLHRSARSKTNKTHRVARSIVIER